MSLLQKDLASLQKDLALLQNGMALLQKDMAMSILFCLDFHPAAVTRKTFLKVGQMVPKKGRPK